MIIFGKMDLKIKGKKVLVTGASRGIGAAIATCLANEGGQVAMAARSSPDLQKILKQLGGEKQGHRAVAIDLTEDGAPVDLLHRLDQSGFGAIEIVVHNLGGTLEVRDPFCPISDWRKLYRLNFEVAVELNLLLVPSMQKRKWGRVVHISSISGMENQGTVPYCSIKAALTAYTRSFGGVVAPDGVVVSAVLPGAIFTEKGDWDRMQKESPAHVQKFLTERQRIGRFGKPEEIGHFVTFLCSNLASFNTGSIIPIDGGQGRGYFGQ